VYKRQGGPHPASAQFDAEEVLVPGEHVDFAVFPGPNGNANFDATEIAVTIAEDR